MYLFLMYKATYFEFFLYHLRFLATGDSVQSMALAFRVGVSTVRKAVFQICKMIWDKMSSIYMKFPETQSQWVRIAEDFDELWQFPNCIGALDGKHFRIQAPKNSGKF